MFTRFSSSGDFDNHVSSRRYDIHRSVWRFNRMCIFDYIIDQIRIQKERQIKEWEVSNEASCFFAKFTYHCMEKTKKLKDIKGGIYYGYFSTCNSISYSSDRDRCHYDGTDHEPERIEMVYEKVHENNKRSFRLFNRGRFSLTERRKVLHGLSVFAFAKFTIYIMRHIVNY